MSSHFSHDDDSELLINKERYSNTTCSSNSIEDSPDSECEIEVELIPSNQDLRFELFESEEHTQEMSQKMSQRAVSWIMTVCWARDLDKECLWYTLLLFYSLKAQKKVRKEQLQLILLTCLSLSLKMTRPDRVNLKELASLTSKSLLIKDIIQMQAQILQSVNYNPIIPHYICELSRCSALDGEKLARLEFICELLMVKSHCIFFDRHKLQILIKILGDYQGFSFQIFQCIHAQIKQMLLLKQCKIVINKYAPKFDVGAFALLFK